MSQEQLGQALEPKMTRASVANIEAGSQRVFLHTAVRLARVLGFNVLDAISGSDYAEPKSNSLANELAAKLPLSPTAAKTLARKIIKKEES